MNDMSAWTRWIFLGCLVAVAGGIYWFSFGPGATSVAEWRVDGAVGPETTEVPLLVNESACASGQSARGRIQEPDVDYRTDAVVVTIRVEQRSGSEDCPSNPDTPYLLRLDEPLGNRTLLDGGKRPPAPPSSPAP